MAADDPENHGKSLESSEEVLFDELVAHLRAPPPRMQPKVQADSLGEADAAYAHGPRAPGRGVDTLPPNQDPPVVLNIITERMKTVPRAVPPEPPRTERPKQNPREDETLPLVGIGNLRRKLVTGAIVAIALLGFAGLVRWRTLSTMPPADATSLIGLSVPPSSSTVTPTAEPMRAPTPEARSAPEPALIAAPRSSEPARARQLPRPTPEPVPAPPPPRSSSASAQPVVVPPPQVASPAPPPPPTAKPKDDMSRTF